MNRRASLFVLLASLAGAVPARAAGSLTVEGTIEAAVAAVWSALTTTAGLQSWMAPHAEIELRINGLMQPSEGFPFPDAVRSMWTVISFEALAPARTRLRVVSLGFGDDDPSQRMRAFFEKGNATTLHKLQEKFRP